MAIHKLNLDFGKAFGQYEFEVMTGISGHGFLQCKLLLPKPLEKILESKFPSGTFPPIEINKDTISKINILNLCLDNYEDEDDFVYTDISNVCRYLGIVETTPTLLPIKKIGVRVGDLRAFLDDICQLARTEYAMSKNSEKSVA